jgi:hypothetical protein
MGRVPTVPKTTLWLLLLLAPGLVAQAKLGAREAMAGTWYLDRSQSDSINVQLVGLLQRNDGGPSFFVPRDVVRSTTGAPPTDRTEYDSRVAERRPVDHRLDVLRQELFPGDSISLEVTDSTVRVMTVFSTEATWRTDGKDRVEAQMDGTMIVTRAFWKGKSLLLSRVVVSYGRLERDFTVAKDGSKLEVKETLAYDDSYKFKIFGFPKTLVFVRTKPAS